MSLLVIDEAVDFDDPIILKCCTYIYYADETSPPWDIDLDIEDW
jgi:hypothetical protein